MCKQEHAEAFGPMYYCTAVWYHAVAQCELEEAKQHLWVQLDRFHKEYEMD